MSGFPSAKKGTARAEKAKRPHPGIPFDKDTLLSLIKKHNGNVSRVADAIGSSRCAIRARIATDKELQEAVSNARERLIDELEESCFRDAIDNRDTGLRCFLLKTQARHRGYEQDEAKNTAKDIAQAAFEFILSKNNKS